MKKGNRDVIIDEGNDTHHIKKGNREVKIDTKDDILTVVAGDGVLTLKGGLVKIN